MGQDTLDLKKELRELYRAPHGSCRVVEVPELHYLMVDGVGDPNTSEAYQEALMTVYPVAYTVKFRSKERGRDFVVMPIQGLWWSEDPGSFVEGDRDAWSWTVLVLQPDFVESDFVEECVTEAAAKRDLPARELLRFERYAEGTAVQTMHRGPYSEEGPTIAMLHEFMKAEGYTFGGKHHEIYLSDPRRAAPENLKTIIRQPVAKA